MCRRSTSRKSKACWTPSSTASRADHNPLAEPALGQLSPPKNPAVRPRGSPLLRRGGDDVLPRLQELLRIDRIAVDAHLVMNVRAGAAPSAAEQSDLLSVAEVLPARHGDPMEMAVDRDDPRAVIDLHHPAIGALGTGEHYDPRRGVVDRRLVRRRKIDAGVEGFAMVDWVDASTERAFELILRDRRAERQRL